MSTSASPPDPLDALLRQRLDLTNALHRLNSLERAVVLMCCQNGRSPEETARILEIPARTVNALLCRGREKLKSFLSL
jgi:DNA-directed RNA polymerase specialized sigma24 family protein